MGPESFTREVAEYVAALGVDAARVKFEQLGARELLSASSTRLPTSAGILNCRHTSSNSPSTIGVEGSGSFDLVEDSECPAPSHRTIGGMLETKGSGATHSLLKVEPELQSKENQGSSGISAPNMSLQKTAELLSTMRCQISHLQKLVPDQGNAISMQADVMLQLCSWVQSWKNADTFSPEEPLKTMQELEAAKASSTQTAELLGTGKAGRESGLK